MEPVLSFNRQKQIGRLATYLYLIIFPLGQLAAIEVSLLGNSVRFALADLIAFAASAVGIAMLKRGVPRWFYSVSVFLGWASLTLLLSLRLFEVGEVLPGVLYLVRVASYSVFSLTVYYSFDTKSYRENVVQLLITASVAIGFFGWVQYLLYPNLTALKALQWDDHLYRLVSTFLDPAFTGILFVFGFIASFTYGVLGKKRIFWLIPIFLLLSLAFTYSRASYLSLIGCTGFLLMKSKKKLAFFLVAFLVLSLPLLPRPGGYGVRLERVHSILLKADDYQKSFDVIGRHPILGVGFNNTCLAKMRYLSVSSQSHACDGMDNSFLFIWGTTGVVGLVFGLWAMWSLWKSSGGRYENWYKASFVALCAHTVFTNTMFYGWAMGWMAILVGVSRVRDNT